MHGCNPNLKSSAATRKKWLLLKRRSLKLAERNLKQNSVGRSSFEKRLKESAMLARLLKRLRRRPKGTSDDS